MTLTKTLDTWICLLNTNICGYEIAHNSVMGFLQGHFLCCGTTAKFRPRPPRLVRVSHTHTHTHIHTHIPSILFKQFVHCAARGSYCRTKLKHRWIEFHIDIGFGCDSIVIVSLKYLICVASSTFIPITILGVLQINYSMFQLTFLKVLTPEFSLEH